MRASPSTASMSASVAGAALVQLFGKLRRRPPTTNECKSRLPWARNQHLPREPGPARETRVREGSHFSPQRSRRGPEPGLDCSPAVRADSLDSSRPASDMHGAESKRARRIPCVLSVAVANFCPTAGNFPIKILTEVVFGRNERRVSTQRLGWFHALHNGARRGIRRMRYGNFHAGPIPKIEFEPK